MDLKNELNSKFMGDRTRTDLLAELTTKEFTQVHERVQLLENALGVMQEAMVKMEIIISTYTGDPNAKPKRKPKKD